MESVHGHEVMEMMLEENQAYTQESLKVALANKFGEEARFHTCSADDMDADGIIEFLEERGKFVALGGGFQTDRSKICNH